MRWIPIFILSLVWLSSSAPLTAAPATQAKIVKVLPTLLDDKGRNSLSPSLYERDAYQAILRKDRTKVHGLRFDVQWKAPGAGSSLVLKLELRTGNATVGKPVVIEHEVKPPRFGTRWSRVIVDSDTFKKSGDVVAWRAVLLEGGTQIAQRTSFLW